MTFYTKYNIGDTVFIFDKKSIKCREMRVVSQKILNGPPYCSHYGEEEYQDIIITYLLTDQPEDKIINTTDDLWLDEEEIFATREALVLDLINNI